MAGLPATSCTCCRRCVHGVLAAMPQLLQSLPHSHLTPALSSGGSTNRRPSPAVLSMLNRRLHPCPAPDSLTWWQHKQAAQACCAQHAEQGADKGGSQDLWGVPLHHLQRPAAGGATVMHRQASYLPAVARRGGVPRQHTAGRRCVLCRRSANTAAEPGWKLPMRGLQESLPPEEGSLAAPPTSPATARTP